MIRKVKASKSTPRRLKIGKRTLAKPRQGLLGGCGRNWDNLCGARN
jgi:hypothetical protein